MSNNNITNRLAPHINDGDGDNDGDLSHIQRLSSRSVHVSELLPVYSEITIPNNNNNNNNNNTDDDDDFDDMFEISNRATRRSSLRHLLASSHDSNDNDENDGNNNNNNNTNNNNTHTNNQPRSSLFIRDPVVLEYNHPRDNTFDDIQSQSQMNEACNHYYQSLLKSTNDEMAAISQINKNSRNNDIDNKSIFANHIDHEIYYNIPAKMQKFGLTTLLDELLITRNFTQKEDIDNYLSSSFNMNHSLFDIKRKRTYNQFCVDEMKSDLTDTFFQNNNTVKLNKSSFLQNGASYFLPQSINGLKPNIKFTNVDYEKLNVSGMINFSDVQLSFSGEIVDFQNNDLRYKDSSDILIEGNAISNLTRNYLVSSGKFGKYFDKTRKKCYTKNNWKPFSMNRMGYIMSNKSKAKVLRDIKSIPIIPIQNTNFPNGSVFHKINHLSDSKFESYKILSKWFDLPPLNQFINTPSPPTPPHANRKCVNNPENLLICKRCVDLILSKFIFLKLEIDIHHLFEENTDTINNKTKAKSFKAKAKSKSKLKKGRKIYSDSIYKRRRIFNYYANKLVIKPSIGTRRNYERHTLGATLPSSSSSSSSENSTPEVTVFPNLLTQTNTRTRTHSNSNPTQINDDSNNNILNPVSRNSSINSFIDETDLIANNEEEQETRIQFFDNDLYCDSNGINDLNSFLDGESSEEESQGEIPFLRSEGYVGMIDGNEDYYDDDIELDGFTALSSAMNPFELSENENDDNNDNNNSNDYDEDGDDDIDLREGMVEGGEVGTSMNDVGEDDEEEEEDDNNDDDDDDGDDDDDDDFEGNGDNGTFLEYQHHIWPLSTERYSDPHPILDPISSSDGDEYLEFQNPFGAIFSTERSRRVSRLLLSLNISRSHQKRLVSSFKLYRPATRETSKTEMKRMKLVLLTCIERKTGELFLTPGNMDINLWSKEQNNGELFTDIQNFGKVLNLFMHKRNPTTKHKVPYTEKIKKWIKKNRFKESEEIKQLLVLQMLINPSIINGYSKRKEEYQKFWKKHSTKSSYNKKGNEKSKEKGKNWKSKNKRGKNNRNLDNEIDRNSLFKESEDSFIEENEKIDVDKDKVLMFKFGNDTNPHMYSFKYA